MSMCSFKLPFEKCAFQISPTGINKQIAVDAAFLPVASSDDPQAVSLPQDLHNNTMLSCLSSGFLCPLTATEDSRDRSLHEPGNNKVTAIRRAPRRSLVTHGRFHIFSLSEEILETAGELEDMHVVCILDLCHLGEDKLEVLINKVYKVAEVAFD